MAFNGNCPCDLTCEHAEEPRCAFTEGLRVTWNKVFAQKISQEDVNTWKKKADGWISLFCFLCMCFWCHIVGKNSKQNTKKKQMLQRKPKSKKSWQNQKVFCFHFFYCEFAWYIVIVWLLFAWVYRIQHLGVVFCWLWCWITQKQSKKKIKIKNI